MLFLQTIPFNLYAWLTILFMLFIIWTGRDFGAMRKSVEKSNAHFEIPRSIKIRRRHLQARRVRVAAR